MNSNNVHLQGSKIRITIVSDEYYDKRIGWLVNCVLELIKKQFENFENVKSSYTNRNSKFKHILNKFLGAKRVFELSSVAKQIIAVAS